MGVPNGTHCIPTGVVHHDPLCSFLFFFCKDHERRERIARGDDDLASGGLIF